MMDKILAFSATVGLTLCVLAVILGSAVFAAWMLPLIFSESVTLALAVGSLFLGLFFLVASIAINLVRQ